MARDPTALRFAGNDVKGDREFMLEVIRVHGSNMLGCASTELKADRGVVLAAIAKHGCERLSSREERLTELQDVVDRGPRRVLGHCWRLSDSPLKFASANLRADREVVLAAAAHSCSALQHAALELMTDREFVLEAEAQRPGVLRFASPQLREDPEFMALARSHGFNVAELGHWQQVVRDAGIVHERLRARGLEVARV